MLTKEGIGALRERLADLTDATTQYFEKAEPVKADDMRTREEHWAVDEPMETVQSELRAVIKRLGVDVAGAARGSPLIAEADLQDLRQSTRQMLASVRFNRYQYQKLYVHHDEDVVLGVDPPSHYEEMVHKPEDAVRLFNTAATGMGDVIDLLSPVGTLAGAPSSASYRPNTAFVMMAIDKDRPELADVKNAFREVFKQFGVDAVTADDIEHDGAITDRVLDEIETSEFLIADLTLERPNVYYEVGHAHARNKRVMLYRKKDTKLHFDLAHRNCPEYANLTELKDLLRKRLEVVTNRPKTP